MTGLFRGRMSHSMDMPKRVGTAWDAGKTRAQIDHSHWDAASASIRHADSSVQSTDGNTSGRSKHSMVRSKPCRSVAYDQAVQDMTGEATADARFPGALTEEVLVKSRQRVADHGEVFTPAWLIEDMLNLVKEESERIDARVLEPACGSGNFLVPVLRRKLRTVEAKFGTSEFERRHHALLALMCIYGIELLPDNADECRANLLDVFRSFLGAAASEDWSRVGRVVLEANIVQGDALDMTTGAGEPITFPEWGYLGRGKFQRRDFRYDALTQRSSIAGSLFEMLEEHEVFVPVRTYPQMNVQEIST